MYVNLKSHGEKIFFLRKFRAARASLLADSEAFLDCITCLEQLGQRLTPSAKSLNEMSESLATFLSQGSAKDTVTDLERRQVRVLLDRVRQARNEAVHTGAFARHLASSCLALASTVEEVLMSQLLLVSDVMVCDVICADAWQPLAYARQAILKNSFSWLPIQINGHWKVLSDISIVNVSIGRTVQEKRAFLNRSIESLYETGILLLDSPEFLKPNAGIVDANNRLIKVKHPILITDSGDSTGHLLGLLTAFDVL